MNAIVSYEPGVDGVQIAPRSGFAQHLDTVTAFLKRRYLGILLCLLLALPIGAAFHFFSTPSYTASAVMLVDSRQTQLFPNSLVGESTQNPSWLENQIGILRSQGVASYVVKQLRLADDPEFVKPDASVLSAMLDYFGITTRIQRAGYGEWLARLGLAEVPKTKTEAERIGEAQAAFIRQLDVKRSGLSNMLRVEFRSRNAEQAAKIANTMVDAYIYDQLTAKYQANRRASDWLLERLQILREEAANAERAVLEFKAKNNIVAAGGRLINEQQLADANGKLVAARAANADIQARLDRMNAVIKSGQESLESGAEDKVMTVDETISDAMASGIIGRLRNQYLDLVTREAAWSQQYGKNHVAVQNLQKQMRDVRRSMLSELTRIRESIRSEYEIAKQREDAAEKGMGELVSQSRGVNQAQIALFNLEATAQSYRKLYDNFLQRHTESVQQQSFPVTEARAIAPAAVQKTGPRPVSIWFTTIFAGGALGVGIGLLRELLDRGFRTREQVFSALSLKCLGLVPMLTDRGMLAILNNPRSISTQARTVTRLPIPAGKTLVKRVHKASRLMRTVLHAPTSTFADAIRMIKLNIDLDHEHKPIKVFGLTSAFAAEGKSSVAAAMATVVAQSGKRVILVDCDMRNPSLSRALAPDAEVGLVEAVRGTTKISELVWTDPPSGLSFLPVSQNPELASSEFLASPEAVQFFAALRKVYDCVIVDLPPMIALADVRAASKLVDGYVMVVEWGSTKVDAVQYALRNAPAIYERTIGIVLNKVDVDLMSGYDSYGASYYGKPYTGTHG